MKWKAKIIEHKDLKRIAVWFEKKPELIARIKQIENACWSNSLKVWHIPNTLENRLRFNLEASKVGLMEDKVLELERFTTYLNTKRYSSSTIKTYREALKSLFLFYNDNVTSPYLGQLVNIQMQT